MSNIIQGVKVDGTIYKYDYESLENLPDPELPSATASDEGKALVVNSTGDPAWRALSSNLPSSTASDEGKALVVNPSGKPVWEELLPTHDTSYDGSDAGKVLTVATNGSLTWEEGGIGDLPLPDDSIEDGAVLMVVDSGDLAWVRPFPDYDEYDDVGKVLMITQNSGMMWHEESLPTYDTSTDVGKVLMITTNGPEWGTPSN